MDQKTVEEIYRRIEGLHIELEPDPTILGPRYITERVATCRNHLNIVSLVRQTISKERRELKRTLAGEEAALAVERDNLLATNEAVRKQPNIKDREAVVNTMLHERLARISQLKADLLDIDTVEQPVKMVHDELIRTAGEIRTQRSMIQSDRTSGGGYGDESASGSSAGVTKKGSPLPSDDGGVDEEELDRIMREHTPLVSTPTLVTQAPVPDSTPAITSGSPAKSPTSVVEEEEEDDLPPEVLAAVAQPSPNSDDDDILKFLDEVEPTPTIEPVTTKKKKTQVTQEPENVESVDFEDILANL